jgi:hypothetical protein
MHRFAQHERTEIKRFVARSRRIIFSDRKPNFRCIKFTFHRAFATSRPASLLHGMLQ